MPIDPPRHNAITAAVGAYNEANLREPLPHIAGRLLIATFPEDDVCQRSQFDLASEGFRNWHHIERSIGSCARNKLVGTDG
jgi:hypothetical protein